MLHPGTQIPNRTLLGLSPAAPPLTMLSHLRDLLWLPSVIMTVERPTHRRAGARSPWREAGSWETSTFPPLGDLVAAVTCRQLRAVVRHFDFFKGGGANIFFDWSELDTPPWI